MPSINDLFRGVVLVLGFGYVARQDRKTWFWSEAVMWGFYSTMIFLFPSFMFPGQESATLDLVVRAVAAQGIAAQYITFNLRVSYDENVIGTMLWAKIVNTLLLVLTVGYSYSQKADIFPDKTLYFDGVAYALSLLTSSYQMWRGQYRVGGREGKDHVSTICRLFFLFSFVSAISFLAFPSWVYFKKPDFLETVTLRFVGTMGIGFSIAWMYASTFRDDRDISVIFKSIFISSALLFIAMCLAYFSDEAIKRQEFLSMHCAFIPVLLAAFGQYLIWKKDSNENSSSYYLRSKSQ